MPRSEVVPEFDSKRLRPERYALFGPTAWADRTLANIVEAERIVDFDPGDQVTTMMLERFGLAAKARPDRHFVNNTDALASMVEDGAGYSALAVDFAAAWVAAGRLAPLGGRRHVDVEFALAWYPRRHMTAYFRDVVRDLK